MPTMKSYITAKLFSVSESKTISWVPVYTIREINFHIPIAQHLHFLFEEKISSAIHAKMRRDKGKQASELGLVTARNDTMPVAVQQTESRRRRERKHKMLQTAIAKVKTGDDPDDVDKLIVQERRNVQRKEVAETAIKAAITEGAQAIIANAAQYSDTKKLPENHPTFQVPIRVRKMNNAEKNRSKKDDADLVTVTRVKGKPAPGKGEPYKHVTTYVHGRDQMERDMARPSAVAELASNDPENALSDEELLDYTVSMTDKEKKKDDESISSMLDRAAKIRRRDEVVAPDEFDDDTTDQAAKRARIGDIDKLMSFTGFARSLVDRVSEEKDRDLVRANGFAELSKEDDDTQPTQSDSATFDLKDNPMFANIVEHVTRLLEENGSHLVNGDIRTRVEQYIGEETTIRDLTLSQQGKKQLNKAVMLGIIRNIYNDLSKARAKKRREALSKDIAVHRESAREAATLQSDTLGHRHVRSYEDDVMGVMDESERRTISGNMLEKLVHCFEETMQTTCLEAAEFAKRVKDTSGVGDPFLFDPMTTTYSEALKRLNATVRNAPPSSEHDYLNIDVRQVRSNVQYQGASVNGKPDTVSIPILQVEIDRYRKENESSELVWTTHPRYQPHVKTHLATLPVVQRAWMEHLMVKPQVNDPYNVPCSNGTRCFGYHNSKEARPAKFILSAFYFHGEPFENRLQKYREQEIERRAAGRPRLSDDDFQHMERILDSANNPDKQAIEMEQRTMWLRLRKRKCILCILHQTQIAFYNTEEAQGVIQDFQVKLGEGEFNANSILLPPKEDPNFRGIIAPYPDLRLEDLILCTDTNPETGYECVRYKWKEQCFQ